MEWGGLKLWYMVLCVRVSGMRLAVSLVCGALCEYGARIVTDINASGVLLGIV